MCSPISQLVLLTFMFFPWAYVFLWLVIYLFIIRFLFFNGNMVKVFPSFLQVNVDFKFIPKLPKVKKLKLIITSQQDDSLLESASIVKACPSLETFAVKVLTVSPMTL